MPLPDVSLKTNQRGFYHFDELEIGRFYILRAESRNYSFAPDSYFIDLTEDREDVNFTGKRLFLTASLYFTAYSTRTKSVPVRPKVSG